MGIDEEFIKKFMEQNPELVLKFKWDAFMTLLEKDEIWTGRESFQKMTIKFVSVFKDHNVDPEIVIEALQTLGDNAPKETSNDDISPTELEGFVSVINKLNKKKEKDDGDLG